jgi:lipoyl(octanoyl) transferase
MEIIDLGLISFEEAREKQLGAVREVAAGAEPRLFLLEHEPVITVGRHGGMESLHADPAWLASRGVALCRAERGGNITCHYPGQLVAYPVFRIEKRKGGLKRFFHDVEEAALRALDDFGVAARRVEGRPGVWTDHGKIASIGIAVKRWVTYHGLALNVAADTSLFDCITLCGLVDAAPDSLHARTGDARPEMKEVKDVLAQRFREVFEKA